MAKLPLTAILATLVAASAPAALGADLSVLDASSTFTAIRGPSGAILTDVALDQQTGQPDSDFVGDTTNPGFLTKLGTVGTSSAMAFRIRLNTYNSNLSNFNVRLGIDSNVDGLIDMYFGVTGGGSTMSFFQSTGGTASNYSPSTTSMTALASSFNVATTASNWRYEATTNLFSNGGSKDNDDALATFILTFDQINSALSSFGATTLTAGGAYRYVAVTSTQTSNVNQDAYGYGNLSTDGSVRYDLVYGTSTGLEPVPIPEPSTWISAGTLILAGFGAWHRRRRAAARAA